MEIIKRFNFQTRYKIKNLIYVFPILGIVYTKNYDSAFLHYQKALKIPEFKEFVQVINYKKKIIG